MFHSVHTERVLRIHESGRLNICFSCVVKFASVQFIDPEICCLPRLGRTELMAVRN